MQFGCQIIGQVDLQIVVVVMHHSDDGVFIRSVVWDFFIVNQFELERLKRGFYA